MKRPSFQFYPADWRNDAALRMCSLTARGLWWEMICVMHAAEPYGYLVAAGEPITDEELARIVGETPADVARWLAELNRRKVYSVNQQGAIFSRRMVKDEAARLAWRARQARHRGAAPPITPPVTPNVTPNVTPTVTQEVTPPVTPVSLCSSSSSSSSSSIPKSRAKKRADAPLPDFPPWAKDDAPLLAAWDEYAAMRKRKNKAVEPGAFTRAWEKLSDWRVQGHDPKAILLHSVDCGYPDIYEPKPNYGGNGGGNSKAAQSERALANWLASSEQEPDFLPTIEHEP